MTALSKTAHSYTDEEFASLIARLNLSDSSSPSLRRTPSPQRQDPTPIPSTPSSQTPLYYYESPNKRGFTNNWQVAFFYIIGVANARVYAIQKRKKKRTKKAAYVVFYGDPAGVFFTWDEAEAAVKGVPGAIFRGYQTVPAAHAAFAYARARGWTRSFNSPSGPPMDALPSPSQPLDYPNPLHDSNVLDDTWYIVYRGIRPGVYHSFLEAQLNTVGLSSALYDSVTGREEAFALFARAREDGRVLVTPAPSYSSTHGPSHSSPPYQ
ncbi:hypothetical protein B0H11DRAFT_1913955 [Mycena galericulata]|nr:hypothetical protein B0H11DRAFT_2237626 [Mycena galericulata]KAJ7486247.1 hypothetical protein B0H11DRAFT_1913955 [Mycena galericulata]